MACWRAVWDSYHHWLEEGLLGGDTDTTNIVTLVTGLVITALIDMGHTNIASHSGQVSPHPSHIDCHNHLVF